MNEPPTAPTIAEMRRVAHYLAETMGLHSAAGKLLAKAAYLESIVDRLMEVKPGSDAQGLESGWSKDYDHGPNY